MDNYGKLLQIMANVFEVEIGHVDENSSKETIINWDSVQQMFLIISLEEAFNVRLSDEEAVKLTSFMMIKSSLEKKGIQF